MKQYCCFFKIPTGFIPNNFAKVVIILLNAICSFLCDNNCFESQIVQLFRHIIDGALYTANDVKAISVQYDNFHFALRLLIKIFYNFCRITCDNCKVRNIFCNNCSHCNNCTLSNVNTF